jgi:hypothetical protein
MKKSVVAFGMLLSSMAFAQEGKDSLRIEIGVKVSQVYKQIATDTYKSEVARTVTNMKISGSSSSGEKLDFATGDVAANQSSLSEIRLGEGGLLEMKDLKKGTSQVLNASFSDNVIIVSSDQIGQSLAAELKKQGQDLVNAMSLETTDGKLTYSLKVSDMACAKAQQTLSCGLSANLVLDVVAK